eukprot:comp17791_c0_seq1/m.17845 comp17791_c0_seq1/g.17845  ORF comp17791_c0_seq1/g.17845 comp17791_c0_seq1/m.17845 type:complete len:704 (-) comp17791_c0_seq1:384-2495(-)
MSFRPLVSRLVAAALPKVHAAKESSAPVVFARTFAYATATRSGRKVFDGLGARWFSTTTTDNGEEKKEGEEEPVKEELIEETEKVTGPAEKHQFQAETRKLLDIVAHSLYSERDVFIREIISNASDALEKLRYLQSTNHLQRLADPDLPLEIKISVDEKKNTFTLQDTGIGMNAEELVKNLGTIAHSGSKAFLQQVANKNEGGSGAKEGIIGQFGVGFYSTFMVGHKVKVYSKSATSEDNKGHLWVSDGTGQYELSEADGVQRGTKIIIELRDDCKKYAQLGKVRDIVQTMSNFVGFPIKVNGDVVNKIQALWTMDAKDITPEMHGEFFRFIGNEWTDPMYHLQYKTDVPIEIKSLFYIPSTHMEKYGMGRMDPGVSLYCRKVLIQNKFKGILPEWMRFVKGVVDSADIPLNLSRELLQDSSLIKRMNDIFSQKIIKFLESQMKKDGKKYDEFYADFGNFIREGVCTDDRNRQTIAKLLRYESSTQEGLTTLKEYVERMPPSQKEIYYIYTPNRSFAETSPYMEVFKQKNIEVLYAYHQLDDIVMNNLQEFDKKKVRSVENSKLSVEGEEKETPSAEHQPIIDFVKSTLGELVNEVKVSTRLTKSPAIVLDHGPAQMRKMLKLIDPNRVSGMPPANMEINPNHEIFKKVAEVKESNSDLAGRIVRQIYDNALISAGLMDDPRVMLDRITSLMQDALAAAEKKL